MARRNAQFLVVIAAALLAGAAVYLVDDALSAGRRVSMRYRAAGGDGTDRGGTTEVPKTDPPGYGVVPAFGQQVTNTEALTHYVRQLPLEESAALEHPSLEQWQRLLAELPRDVPGSIPLTLPLGANHFVMAMCTDQEGNYWLGTEGEGLFRYSPSKPAAEQWAQFTVKDGLGDNHIYALVCDLQGRIWCGHLNHGVSVFNGQQFQNYEVVPGLSRPGTLAGPLGERCFGMTVCHAEQAVARFKDPRTGQESSMNGSIWICTSAGLAIYFPSTDTWSYLTRADGLPSDQANSLAFDQEGTAFLGTQCDGIALAWPADHYATWKVVTVDNPTPHAVSGTVVDTPVPPVGQGSGIPTNLINTVYVATDQTVYAATTLGLAWSTDHGRSWQYVRGADWIDKVKNRMNGSPKGWQAPTGADKGGGILAEDYTTALAENQDGRLLVGHRATSGDILAIAGPDRAVLQKVGSLPNVYATSLLPVAGNKDIFLGTYGQGLSIKTLDQKASTPEAAHVVARAKLPEGAAPLTAEQVRRLAQREPGAQAISDPVRVAGYLGEDWLTQGDWVGRYGRRYALLCGADSPRDHEVCQDTSACRVTARQGPHADAGDALRHWLEKFSTEHPSALWNPVVGTRRQAEWDDHAESYSVTREGLGLVTDVVLPSGLNRVSIYFFPFRGQAHAMDREYRDLVISAGEKPASASEPWVPLMRTRVQDFDGGVYKQFVLEGGKAYRFKIERNFSYNTIVNGIFVDSFNAKDIPTTSKPLAWMGDVPFGPPETPGVMDEVSEPIRLLWERYSQGSDMTAISHLRADRVLAYRAALHAPGTQQFLANWRWMLNLWMAQDRADFASTMELAWHDMQRMEPRLRTKIYRPYSPDTFQSADEWTRTIAVAKRD